MPAVLSSFKFGFREMGPARTGKVFLKMNQDDGFDCPGCAWPEPDDERQHRPSSARTAPRRSPRRRRRSGSTPEFFAEHTDRGRWTSSRDLLAGPAGPAHRADGAAARRRPTTSRSPGTRRSRSSPTSCKALDDPNEAVFYTSGRTSNEAAFLYQLFAAAFGTNNLPDCSNMCHESSGIGADRDDRHRQGHASAGGLRRRPTLIFVVGQNPGTNHPRMLTALESGQAERRARSSRSTRCPRPG